MPIDIIDKGFGEKFNEELLMTNSSIFIISPFISFKTAKHLAEWLNNSNEGINCTIITRFNREEFLQGANSLEGLEVLYKSGAAIYALQHLHSKLYVFDNRSAILGSANFTFSGFFRNHELGIFVHQEKDFVGNTLNYAKDLLSSIKSAGEFELTEDIIKKEKEQMLKLLSQRTSRSTHYNNQYRWGAVIDIEENENEKMDNTVNDNNFDILEKVIEEEPVTPSKRTGIWLKFEGTSEERIPNTMQYMQRKNSLQELLDRTYYPRPPRSVDEGDIVFIAALSYDKNGIETPMIVGYATAQGYDERNIVYNGDKEFREFNNRYPYYIELTDGKFLNTSIGDGISLIELCNTLKHNVYPNTQSKPSTEISSILKRHHQKAHIQITSEARDYLVNRLERIFNLEGFDVL
ncbi:phospholipase D-like domain-containing protein [Guptibacillus hwajinpoensis]|uniref:phospholipase D-like domain-containing protein n=1 Tax=Guptibacillus hwajinpoensis TaxID=208199 RepID=UPI003D0343DC